MAGPNGELCTTCYYYEQIGDGPAGFCRHDHATAWIGRFGQPQVSNWPRVNLDTDQDWSGDWVDKNAPGIGTPRGIGAFVTPRSTVFSITDTTNWTRFNPPNLYAGELMYNATLNDGVLTINIPGTYGIGVEWEGEVNLYGSVEFPTANRWLEVAPAVDGVPFSDDTVVRMEVTAQMDDVALPFAMTGIAKAAAQVSTELVMRGNIGNAIFYSCVYQVNVLRI